MKNKGELILERFYDGMDYFQEGRFEELKSDDRFYITGFITLIKTLTDQLVREKKRNDKRASLFEKPIKWEDRLTKEKEK